jgi:chromate transporter
VSTEAARTGDTISASERPAPVSLGEATAVWARIALLSFGGPAGQIALMHRVLVDEKRWIGEKRFLHALSFCTLLPGPEAQQLATYIGWLMHRNAGGLIAGGLFILPGIVAIMALSWLYVLLGHTVVVQGLFFGLKAAVIAIVLQAMIRIATRALVGPLQHAIAIAAFLALFLLDAPFPLVVIGAGLIGFAAAKTGLFAPVPGGHGGSKAVGLSDEDSLLGAAMPPHALPGSHDAWRVALVWLAVWLVPVAALLLWLGPDHVQSRIALFFSKMAVVTFGGAYAVLAYVAQAAVETYHWLRPGEMLDGLGMAETTPGPLIMVLQFVGFLAAYRDPGSLPPLLAGTLGGLVATFVTFAPCFLWIFLGAPYVERLRENRALAGALAAITAAVVGVIANLALWFALHTIFGEVRKIPLGPVQFDLPVLASVNLPALLLAAAAAIAMLRFKVGFAPTLAACAVAGLAIRLFG